MRAKTKMVKVGLASDDEDIGELFNNMVGTANLNFAYPRYLRIKTLFERLAKLFQQFSTSPTAMRFPECKDGFATMSAFSSNISAETRKIFSINLGGFSFDYNSVDEPLKETFLESYDKMRKCGLTKDFIKMCNDLHCYRDCLNLDKPSADFILHMPGADFSPFPFNFNVKQLASVIIGCDDGTTEAEEFCSSHLQLVVTYLGTAYKISKELWDELQQPDADVKKFIGVLMAGMKKFELMPEFSRCKQAFTKIREGVGMLEERFSQYYRDFVVSGNKNIIMEHFVLDLAKESGDSDPELMRQFNVIIFQYRKKLEQSGHLTDDRMTKTLDKLMGIFCSNDADAGNLLSRDDPNAPADADVVAPRSKYELFSPSVLDKN